MGLAMAANVKKTSLEKITQATEGKPFGADAEPESDEGAWNDDGLTLRQHNFVTALVGPAGGNLTKAAEMAGYKSDNRIALRSSAYVVLNNPNVQEAIARAFARRRMTPEWTKERLVEIASSSMRNFMTVNEAGEMSVNWKLAAENGAIGQIREIREDVIIQDGKPAQVIKRSFKLHDPSRALEVILKLSGALIDRHDVTVKMDLTNLSDDDLQRLREIHAKAAGGRLASAPNGN